jgi:hypothetical protein
MSGSRKIVVVDDSCPEPPSGQDGASDSNLVIRVRRGALRRFDQLKAKSDGLPVEITWDRRSSERRAPTDALEGDRRRSDRRQKPPYTWDAADFLVVGDSSRPDDGPDTPPAPPKKR